MSASRLTSTDELCTLLGIPFSEAQLAAIIAAPDTVQAIIAGAGSGKTAVMAARVVWLVGHHGIDPERILGLTFTNKAAGELGRRIGQVLGLLGVALDDAEPTVATYNAFASSLISEHGLRIGMEPDLRVVSDATRFQLAARVLRAYRDPLDHLSTHVPTLIEQVLKLDEQLSEHLVSTEQLRAFDRQWIAEIAAVAKQQAVHADMTSAALKRLELSHLVDAYRAAKTEAGVVNFSDQMAAGARLSELPPVQADLRGRFDIVLLDEYQDTSVSQRILLQNLFARCGASAVGDPAQGIYGWRGAASGNLVSFLDHFAGEGHGQQPHSLAVSQRCGAEIIEVAGHVAKEFYASEEVRGVVRPLAAAPHTGEGFVSAALHLTVGDEIDDLTQRVLAAHERTGWRDIAVLVRAAKENENIVASFRAHGIPFEILGLNGLLDVPEVLDVLALLEVTEELTANVAMLRLLTGPRWRIGDRDLALLGRRARDLSASYRPSQDEPEDPLAFALDSATAGLDPTEVVSLAEAVESPGELEYSSQARERFAELTELLQRMRRHSHEPLLDLARRAVRELDLDVELAVCGIGTDQLDAFLDAVAEYARGDRFASLAGLLAYIEAERQHNRGMERVAPSDADSVKIMTAHKSKGLEFDEVFVPLVSKGVFPSDKGRAAWITNGGEIPIPLRGDVEFLPELIEFERDKDVKEFKRLLKADSDMEERRLAYVAFTRARKRLHVSGHRWGRTQKQPRAISPFLEAVREWLIGRGREPEVWADEPEKGLPNPYSSDVTHQWPRRLVGLQGRRDAVRRVEQARPDEARPPDRLKALAAEVDQLLAEAKEHESQRIGVRLPEQISTTASLELAKDRQEFARRLARPMPIRPSGAARFGTKFHAWLEAQYGQQALLDPADLPGRGDADIDDDSDLDRLKQSFAESPYADRRPVGIEVPFTIVIGGQQVIGRIDAVFEVELADGTGGWEVVDWKTNKAATADPLQLAVYRLAWAQLRGVDPSQVIASFHYVRLGRTDTFAELPTLSELAELWRLP